MEAGRVLWGKERNSRVGHQHRSRALQRRRFITSSTGRPKVGAHIVIGKLTLDLYQNRWFNRYIGLKLRSVSVDDTQKSFIENMNIA